MQSIDRASGLAFAAKFRFMYSQNYKKEGNKLRIFGAKLRNNRLLSTRN